MSRYYAWERINPCDFEGCNRHKTHIVVDGRRAKEGPLGNFCERHAIELAHRLEAEAHR